MMNNKKTVSRRQFMKKSLVGAALLASASSIKLSAAQKKAPLLRLGGPTFEKYDNPDSWVKVLKKLGYRAAYCPVGAGAKDDVVRAYAAAAKKADIIIAEVGAWSNPISPDEKTRLEPTVASTSAAHAVNAGTALQPGTSPKKPLI
jgi:anaerobic selenocysteine-containing dehydrogenase